MIFRTKDEQKDKLRHSQLVGETVPPIGQTFTLHLLFLTCNKKADRPSLNTKVCPPCPDMDIKDGCFPFYSNEVGLIFTCVSKPFLSLILFTHCIYFDKRVVIYLQKTSTEVQLTAHQCVMQRCSCLSGDATGNLEN
ncbi:hypothetical protein XENOCAPTIV_024796 [Xenoophorus captivus]|uniref:Uncharacterized protein n=1 Tax=Xenoophorus captivus TaxID=1517983 RepID=A0ABV0Q637_9TELE